MDAGASKPQEEEVHEQQKLPGVEWAMMHVRKRVVEKEARELKKLVEAVWVQQASVLGDTVRATELVQGLARRSELDAHGDLLDHLGHHPVQQLVLFPRVATGVLAVCVPKDVGRAALGGTERPGGVVVAGVAVPGQRDGVRRPRKGTRAPPTM